MSKQVTVNVKAWGMSTPAYAEKVVSDESGRTTERVVVRVWDDVAQHYTTNHSLSLGQQRYVIGRTLPSKS